MTAQSIPVLTAKLCEDVFVIVCRVQW